MSTFSWRSFLSFFAFKEGMLDTQISALGGWPTVSQPFLRQKNPADMPVITNFKWREPARGGSGGVFIPIARRSTEEYPGSTRDEHYCSPTVSAHVYCGGLHHAAQRHHPHPRHRTPPD